jgi:hypothetical protein
MDLYTQLGEPHRAIAALPGPTAEDGRPRPLTTETKVVETTDESGLLAAFSRVTL